jgi:hypothetical protein
VYRFPLPYGVEMASFKGAIPHQGKILHVQCGTGFPAAFPAPDTMVTFFFHLKKRAIPFFTE